jgi:predicted extracellular nuclease
MRISTTRTLRIVAGGLALVAVGTVSCNDTPTAPQSVETGMGLPGTARFDVVGSGPSVVISQVYGGGGNLGATYKNDFIELHNRTAQPVSIAGWSVQYTSAAGTSWAVTPITGTIQPGAYYLVQEAAGTGGTTALPTPDASGGIAMALGAGKVSLVATTTALTGACPTGFVDMVSFGTTASNCGSQTTATLTNSTAALRLDGGCTFTADQSKDFTTGPAAPRNSAIAAYTCTGVGPQIGPLDHLTITGANSAVLGGTIQFGATGFDKDGTALSPQPTIGWTTSDATVVDVNPTTGAATAAGIGQATITAASGTITATTVVTVSAPADVRGKLVISQVYGGGGNANATLKNDFIELFNPGTEAVSLAGWSVQYNSANGLNAWQVTPLSGTIPAGGYYLVQQSAGTGGTANLPTPELIGGINMSGTDGLPHDGRRPR